jgi:hypothetical protein
MDLAGSVTAVGPRCNGSRGASSQCEKVACGPASQRSRANDQEVSGAVSFAERDRQTRSRVSRPHAAGPTQTVRARSAYKSTN